jgi:MscS family membrane protein
MQTMTFTTLRRSSFGFVLCMLLALAAAVAHAQPAPTGAPTPPANVEADSLGRETPQGMVAGLMNGLAAADYALVSRYFQVAPASGIGSWSIPTGPTFARQFHQVLDRLGSVTTPAALSSDPQGRTNDGLEPDLERFGALRTSSGEVPLLARRVEHEGRQLWFVSDRTLAEVAWLARSIERGTLGASWLDRLPAGPDIGGAPVSHWILLLVAAALSFGLALALSTLRRPLQRLLRNGGDETKLSRFIEASSGPLRLLLTVIIFSIAVQALGISVFARYRMMFVAQMVGWAAVTWLLWRWIDAACEVVLGQMSRRGQLTAYSAVSFLNRALKALLFVLLLAAMLRAFGINVTAGLAALGVGGLAIALGAQKLFENLIGSLTLVADRPVRIGDFCRFGTRLGTVEEIGIRSTRIRTLDRTVLTVPNGEFSSLHIENFSQRDRFWFHPTLNLRYETTPAQMRRLLDELRAMLEANPNVDAGPRVRFISLGSHALDVEIFAYVRAKDFSGFLEVQESLLLRAMEIVEQVGTGFAFPSQTLYLGRDKGLAAAALPDPETIAREMERT